MKKLLSNLVSDLKLSAQTKTFWVSLIAGLIAVIETIYTAFIGDLPDGMSGNLVTVGNIIIAGLVGAGLIKNTNGDDLAEKQTEKAEEKLTKTAQSLGLTNDQLKSVISMAQDTSQTATTAGGDSNAQKAK